MKENNVLDGYYLACMPTIKNLSPKQIKQIRLRENASQLTFAKFLNISLSTVKRWEQGISKTNGGLLKLLNFVAHKGLNALNWNKPVSSTH